MFDSLSRSYYFATKRWTSTRNHQHVSRKTLHSAFQSGGLCFLYLNASSDAQVVELPPDAFFLTNASGHDTGIELSINVFCLNRTVGKVSKNCSSFFESGFFIRKKFYEQQV